MMAEAMVSCFWIDRYTTHEDRVFVKAPSAGNIYLTKAVKDILVIRWFLDLDPELFVICMVRDPRDAVVSKHGKAPDRYWAGLRYWNTYISCWRRVHEHPRFITIRYEDFSSAPDKTQETLIARMPFLEAKAPFSRYHEISNPSEESLQALGKVRPIAADGIGSWRQHLPRLAGQILIHGSISEDLIEFGYEKDDGWMVALDGVTPDVAPGHWPEHFTRASLMRRKLPAYPRIVAGRLRRTLDRGSWG